MSNLASSNVFVFPCISRTGDYAVDSKLLSEKNLSNIIKCVTDKKSFVINNDLSNLEFVLDGYYFKLNSYTLTGTVYAYLTYKESDETLLKGDGVNNFMGLNLTGNRSEVVGEYLLLCKDETIPPESQVKFVMTSIDCGEVPETIK